MRRLFFVVLFFLSQIPLLSAFQSVVFLPFSNQSEKQEIYWLGEGFAESLREELLLKELYVIRRQERQQAYEDLRLPYIGDLSRATMLKIGEELGADYIVFGSYNLADTTLSVQARVIRLSTLKLSDPINASGPLEKLYDIQKNIRDGLVQYFATEKFVPSETEVQQISIPLHAYEAYIKGLLESSDAERIKFFQRAIQENPGYAQAIYRMGQALSGSQRYKESNECLSKGTFQEPLATRVKFLQGLNSYMAQSYDEAYQTWNELSKLKPSPELMNNVGIALMQKKDFQNSGWFLSKAIEAEPDNPDYRFNLAASYIMRSFEKNAIEEYRELIKLRNNDYQTFYFAAKLLEKQATADKTPDLVSKTMMQFFNDTLPTDQKGKFPEMYTTILQLLRPSSEFLLPEESQYRSASVKNRRQEYDTYVKTYEDSARKALDDDDPAKALMDIRKAIGLSPLNADLHQLNGRALLVQKNLAAAEPEFNFSIWCQDNLESHLLLAELYRDSEKFSDAKIQVQKSLALDPNNKRAMDLWNKIWDKN